MTNPLPAPGPVLVPKSTACPGKLVHPWRLVTEGGNPWIDQWTECTACGHRCGMDENPEHSAPVVAKVASLPEGNECPY